MIVDIDAIEATLRAYPCGRCVDGQTTAPCRGCEDLGRKANDRARRGLPSVPTLKHAGACTASPIMCPMCKGTGKRMPSHGPQTLALIAELRTRRQAAREIEKALRATAEHLAPSTRATLREIADVVARMAGPASPKKTRPLPNRPIPYTTTDLRGSPFDPASTNPNRPRAKR